MKRKSMKVLLVISAILLIARIAKIAYQKKKFNKEVTELFSSSGNNSNMTFSYQQLNGLPEPVQKYFRHVLKEGQPYINFVRLLHDGQFKTGPDKDWIDIKGEQYFTTQKPGFIWQGNTSMFTAKDSYIKGKGHLTVSLLSLLNIVEEQGNKINQGELLRWLGESVWFPTNLLPNENLQWLPINSSTAKLIFKYNGLEVYHIVSFNDKNEIIQMKTERFMDDNLETWVGEMMNYNEVNNVLIPTEIEATWKLKTEDYSYAKFNIKKIEYDKPERFYK